MENLDAIVGQVLKKFREGKGLSQEELAWESQLHRTYISQLERGLKSLTLKSLVRICFALDVLVSDFIKEVEQDA